jgi:hypothetical protein
MFLKAAGAVIGTGVVLAGLSLAAAGFNYWTAPIFGKADAERSIESGPSRIALYTQFFQLCGGVQSLEGQIDSQVAYAESVTGDAKTKALQNVAGLKGRRAQVIADYNSQATMKYTAARFLDANLPYQISPVAYDGHSPTVCAAH